MSRTAIASAFVAALFLLPSSLPAAAADTVDISTVTCADLTQAAASTSDNDHYGAASLLTWLAGYNATDDQGPVIDFDGLKTDIEKVVEFCRGNPKIGIATASEKFMGANGTPQGSEAIDLSTVKCEKVINAANTNTEGLGIILMWLAGYYASDAENTVIDFAKLKSEGAELGKTCAENTQNGLITVTEKLMQQ